MKKFIAGLSLLLLFPLLLLESCFNEPKPDNNSDSTKKLVIEQPPAFDASKAFDNIKKQVGFGYRIPGTPTHKACAEWLIAELKQYCDTVLVLKSTATTWDKKSIPVTNIMGKFNPASKRRLLLSSHWDSRPIADQDTAGKDKPIAAANDGASGVGILLEIARNLKGKKTEHGVDIVFFDAEDLGNSSVENSFCLGSQNWGTWAYENKYMAQYGINLDMVGAKNAVFRKENNSINHDLRMVNHLWAVASELGFDNYFQEGNGGEIIDDHVYVFRNAKISMIDIIHYDPNSGKGFPATWHTHADNLDNIDLKTLEAVGKVLSAVVVNLP